MPQQNPAPQQQTHRVSSGNLHDVYGVRDNLRSASSWGTSSSAGLNPTLPSQARFDGAAYQSLKQRVSNLKQEQQRVLKTQRSIEERESAALVEQRQRYEAQIAQLEDKLSQLKAALDRGAKLRTHHEREKKSMSQQLDQLKVMLDDSDKQHEAQLEKLSKAHTAKVCELEAQLTTVRDTAAADAAARDKAHAAALEDVDGWCTGEVEAVRAQAAKQQQLLQEQLEKWKEDYESQRQTRLKVEDDLREAEQQLALAQGDAVRLSDQLAQAQMSCETLQHQLEQANEAHSTALEEQAGTLSAQHEQQVLALKARHAQQLELINSRLQDVIGRKDATIASLRTELSEVYAKLQQFEGL